MFMEYSYIKNDVVSVILWIFICEITLEGVGTKYNKMCVLKSGGGILKRSRFLFVNFPIT